MDAAGRQAFELEPIAEAFDYERRVGREALTLIVGCRRRHVGLSISRRLRRSVASPLYAWDPRVPRGGIAGTDIRLAGEVEQAKIRSGADGAANIDLSYVEPGLRAKLDAHAIARHLAGLLERVVLCAHECVRRAGLKAANLDALYLNGGSSALMPFQQALRRAFPETELIEGDLFGGVASGLAYAGEWA